jgi:hypothetical protein
MMDFPTPTFVGQVFNPGTGPIYTWDGVAWSLTPVNVKTARSRNLMFNPAALISQENGTSIGSSNGFALADNWTLGFTGLSSQGTSFRTGSVPSPDNSISGVNYNVLVAKASLAVGDYMYVMSRIEGIDLVDLQWGTPTAKPIVVRFNTKAEVPGTYGFSIRNAGLNRSYTATIPITSNLVWQTVTLAIPGDTTGTWDKGETSGMSIGFCGAAGTNYTGVTGWQAGNILAPPNMINNAAVANKNWFITDLGVYEDPDSTGVAPAWQLPDYAADLAKCRRYWQSVLANHRFDDSASTGVSFGVTVKTRETMRTIPTISPGAAPGFVGWTNDTWSMADVDTLSIYMQAVAVGPVSRLYNKYFSLNARM